MAQPLTFDFVNSIIEVPTPDTTLDIQYLINQIRDKEDDAVPAMVYPKIADASGKEDLGGGVKVGITVRLLNSWQVRFQARAGPTYTQCQITGGNLVGGLGGNPIATSAFTQVVQVSSAAATIAVPSTASDLTNLRYLVESQRGLHSATGNIYYWDPVSGSDGNDGKQPSKAVKTFAQAQILVLDGNYDIIYCLSSDPSGITTVTETLNITKKTLKIRGPGYTFQLKPTLTTADTVVINTSTVEIAGLYISTATTGTRNAVSITGDNNMVRDCWIASVRGHGVAITTSSMTKINGCAIEHCGLSAAGDGINIGASTNQTVVLRNIIFDNINGITLGGSAVADNIIDNNLIYQHTTYGVDIGSGVLRTHVRGGNTFNRNLVGDTRNLGTNTYIETQAGGASPTQIAAAVWDEVIASHLTAGTTGRTLRDAKTKATLASLS